MALPLGTTGSLWPAFASARLVGLAVKPAYANALDDRFPTGLSGPSRASVTFWEATAPVKLPTRQCPSPRLWAQVRLQSHQGWYFKVASTETSVPVSKAPTYPTHDDSKVTVKLQ